MKMTHPETDLTIDVPSDAVGVYETQGWVAEAAPAEDEPAQKRGARS